MTSSNPEIPSPGSWPVLQAGQKIIDRYRLNALRGSLGATLVWEALDEKSEAHVWLHVLPSTVSKDQTTITRLRDSITQQRHLDPPGILKAQKLVRDGDACMIVSETRLGGLLSLSQNTNHLEPLAVAKQLVDLLKKAHATGLFHLDICPENILLDREGNLLLAGLSTSRILKEALRQQMKNREGSDACTSPQILDGHQGAATDDIYSLGCVIKQLFVSPPHQNQMTQAWADILDGCLAYEPTRRPSLAQLERAIETLNPKPKRNQKPILWIAGLLVSGIAAWTSIPGQNPFPEKEVSSPHKPETSSREANHTNPETEESKPQENPAEYANSPEERKETSFPPKAEATNSQVGRPISETKETNSQENPVEYTNSLGMKFVRAGDLLFCIWETRCSDFDAFVRATNYNSTAWRQPGFKQGPDHPAVNVSWDDAMAFCDWLTKKEQQEGLLPAAKQYRLPSDQEWSNAVGLGQEEGSSPEARDMGVPDIYPWGRQWPPPVGAGNYTGDETGSDVAIKGYDDAFPWTAPVGSFTPNVLGIYDLGGNVWEWCTDWWNSEQKAKVLRGGSWYNGALRLSLLSSSRVHALPASSTDNYGFRCVISETEPQR